ASHNICKAKLEGIMPSYILRRSPGTWMTKSAPGGANSVTTNDLNNTTRQRRKSGRLMFS
ncbi:MAG: hypothetical protein ACK5S6_03720, partial [bacterium]